MYVCVCVICVFELNGLNNIRGLHTLSKKIVRYALFSNNQLGHSNHEFYLLSWYYSKLDGFYIFMLKTFS